MNSFVSAHSFSKWMINFHKSGIKNNTINIATANSLSLILQCKELPAMGDIHFELSHYNLIHDFLITDVKDHTVKACESFVFCLEHYRGRVIMLRNAIEAIKMVQNLPVAPAYFHAELLLGIGTTNALPSGIRTVSASNAPPASSIANFQV